MKNINVRFRFTEDVLGTASNDRELHLEYIASKAPDAMSTADEVAAIGVGAVDEKGRTVFAREKGIPILWDYQIKGFFKDACGMLARVAGTKSNKLKAYKKVIDGLVFVAPRKIPLAIPGGAVGRCDRPLRAQTAQGERIAIASSETAPSGTTCEVMVCLLDEGLEGVLQEWLDYGSLRGIGQWRNSGKGRFTYEIL